MDIFTTLLTRVVQVPIKPADLKVKALVKDAGASKLKEDLDHLENHDYYFTNNKSGKEKDDEQKRKQDNHLNNKQAHSDNGEKESTVHAKESDKTESKVKNKEKSIQNENGITESEDGVKHLDLYV